MRWLSTRALLLHLTVAIVAPGCALAGWWQATRALSGNGLSWVYSVEWPVFSCLAISGWWNLIHEDPEAYRARRARARIDETAVRPSLGEPAVAANRTSVVEPATARRSMRLAVAVVIEVALGTAALLVTPVGRPSGWLPAQGRVIYLVHAFVGLLIVLGALALVVHVRAAGRNEKMVAWTGLVAVFLAGAGGLLTEAQSLVRFLGLSLMAVGTCMALFAYLIPTFLKSSSSVSVT